MFVYGGWLLFYYLMMILLIMFWCYITALYDVVLLSTLTWRQLRTAMLRIWLTLLVWKPEGDNLYSPKRITTPGFWQFVFSNTAPSVSMTATVTAKFAKTHQSTARAAAQPVKQHTNNSDLTSMMDQKITVTLPVWWWQWGSCLPVSRRHLYLDWLSSLPECCWSTRPRSNREGKARRNQCPLWDE